MLSAAPMDAVPAIEARKLRRELRSGERWITVLDDVDLVVPAGEWLAVQGPSGSGKSTLLALLAGLDRPTSGSVLVDGVAIEAMSEDELAILRRQKIGFVFQSFQLMTNLTARENVRLPLELQRASKKGRPARERANDLLAEVGLADRGHHYPSQLSGGEQQRVALARAFATEPRLLLADEPTGNLDTKTGESVLNVLAELHQRTGTTLIMVTHDPQVAARADREIRLEDGRVAPAPQQSSSAAGDASPSS